ncbi:two-component system sensor histidine kinase NtrB [Alterisphingorhabdus coralli]|uniref:histidine kinase n=1 Tax=Alterisphingorhabdus coralli TaxID=3071408 RepID=A0AA97I0C9_9SPHN|nr:ATP-binding protein [Parasphingorhabdus sp. SCSIO 66989]WOE74055.1 ATP-binding protein [Parasphingorhabdus sp. SCSIO 66989]
MAGTATGGLRQVARPELKDAESAITEKSLPGLSDAAGALPIAILVIAPNGKIAEANAAAETMLEASSKKLTRHAFSTIMRFADPRLARALDDPEADVTVRAAPCRIKGIDKPFTIDLSLSPMEEWPGWRVAAMIPSYAPDGIASYAEKDSDMLALRGPEILAHEIKNPLAGIRGAAQLLARKQKKAGNAAEADLVSLISTEVDHIAELIDRMQFLGRDLVGEMKPVNFYEVLSRVKMLCIAEHGSKIRIIEHYDPSLPEILASEPALTQILLNLVSNAADACCDQPDPVITLSSHYAPGLSIANRKSDGMIRLPVEIRVSDNGPGIAESIKPHLFTPFVTSKTKGQGLGLALVRQMVTQMQGRIVQRRHEEKGQTQFRLFFASVDRQENMMEEQP